MDDAQQERFGIGKFTVKPEAVMPHFKPDPATGRDRFGNRMFTSKEFAYYERKTGLVKAGLLVSKEGETFIKSHPGILNAIDRAVTAAQKEGDPDQIYELGRHGTIKYLSEGSQSIVYKLDTNEESYVIKVPTPAFTDIDQPYVNEMLQVQELTAEHGQTFAHMEGKLPTFLFASGQVSCVKFEEGRHPSEFEMASSSAAAVMYMIAKDYIQEKQKQGDPLWHNIMTDFEQRLDGSYRKENFIMRKDGVMVWVDPFLYSTFSEETLQVLRGRQLRSPRK